MPGLNTSTGSTTGVQTPSQQALSGNIFQQLMAQITQGPNVTAAQKNQVASQVNQNAAGAQAGINANAAATGFGSSGKVGQQDETLGVARTDAIQQGDQALQSQANQQFQQDLGLGENFIQPFSSSTSATPSMLSAFSSLLGSGGLFGSGGI
jgi:hypothetical protein